FYSEHDADFDAVQVALNERYIPSRFWLAWNDVDASPEDAAQALRCRSIVPSVMLFRERASGDFGPRGVGKYLVALLVGESPAWGLHKRAMAKARELAAEARVAAMPDADAFDIRIVGPVYSGTTES